jgi:hypothetical protein
MSTKKNSPMEMKETMDAHMDMTAKPKLMNGGGKSKKTKKSSKSKKASKSMKSSSGLPAEMPAYCLSERKPCTMVNCAKVTKKTKTGRTMHFIMGTCKRCGGKVSKTVSKTM